MSQAVQHRVVITGLGMSTALGHDLPTCWRRALAGENGVRPISYWDPAAYGVKVAAEAHQVPHQETGNGSSHQNSCRRGVRLFMLAAREAIRDAQLDQGQLLPADIGVAAGASVSYLDMHLLKQYFRMRRRDKPQLDMARFAREGEQPASSFQRRLGDMMAAVPARMLKLAGPAFVVDTACAASAHAIGEAYRLVKRGKVKAMLAGGSAALVSPLSILAFALIGALSLGSNPEEASRPFDRKRDGFVMGEGAGVVILESLESARERGARIYAELAGYGLTLNAYTLTEPDPGGDAEAAAMRLALAEANVAPDQVDYVAAHGTSTPKNDATETAAIKQVFGNHARRLMVSSIKSQIGHTISAAGACNLICAVKAITDGQAPPTMHLHHADPECDLDYVANQSRRATIRTALANSFAFGGQNAVLAVRAWAS